MTQQVNMRNIEK